MDIAERVTELEDEIEGLRSGLEQHESVIDVLGEALLAVALSIPGSAIDRHAGARRIEHVLREREITNRPLGSMAVELLETLRDDLGVLAGGDEPPPPGSPSRPRLTLLRGGKAGGPGNGR